MTPSHAICCPMSPDTRQTAQRRRSSGAQLVCTWMHLTPRECYTLARVGSEEALSMAEAFGLEVPTKTQSPRDAGFFVPTQSESQFVIPIRRK